MRTFTLGQGAQRKFVVIDVQGARMAVTHGKPDAAPTRQEKTLASEVEARKAADMMVKELLARGFVEQSSSGPKVHPSVKTPPAAKAASASRVGAAVGAGPARPAPPPPPAPDPDAISYDLLEEEDDEAVPAAPLARLAPPPKAAEAAPAKPRKKAGKKKKKKGSNPDGLDKRVLYAVGAIGLGIVAFGGWLAWDIFLKPPSLVATWKGNRTEHETGGPISYSTYVLILDEQKRAAFAVNDEKPETGTYEMKDGRLLLHLKDQEGDPSEVAFKASLGRGSLDLFDVNSGQKVVQLLRTFEKPVVGGGPAAPPPPTAAGPGGDVNAPADAAADAALASVDYAAKDGAFRLKAPPGWEHKDGARPDNTYSWVRFEKGSAKIEVRADVTGSLMTGSPADGQYEEGSEFAPVQNAHELYKQTVKDEYSDLAESEPTLFKSAQAGEGRISAFTAAGGGLFGGKIQGYRVTFLTNNRRVTVLCDAPQKEFAGLKPTFLAVCRSVAR